MSYSQIDLGFDFNPAEIRRTEGIVFFRPLTNELQKLLQVERSTIGDFPIGENGKPDFRKERQIIKVKEDLFSVLEDGWAQTIPGFYADILSYYNSHGFKPVAVKDERVPFPKPLLDRAYGFRGNQKEKFEQLVLADESGGLRAPTRWGKSVIIQNLLRVYPNLKTLITAPGVNLLKQTYEELIERFPDRSVGLLEGSRKKKNDADITVASMSSLHKADLLGTRLLIIDEPHALASEGRTYLFASFVNARRFAVGASWSGRFDKADKIIKGIVGPIHASCTFSEAVQSGNICPIRVYMVSIPFDPRCFFQQKREAGRKALIFHNQFLQQLMADTCKHMIPPEWQTMLFVDREAQADELLQKLPEAEVAMDKKFKNAKEAESMRERVVTEEVKKCIATSIYSTGLTFPGLRVMLNLCAGGGSITSVQKPGRLAQIIPGKKRGYVVDYMLEPTMPEHAWKSMAENRAFKQAHWHAIVRECKARRKVYQDLGYEVVDTPVEFNTQFNCFLPSAEILATMD